jgi:hypothetical protein
MNRAGLARIAAAVACVCGGQRLEAANWTGAFGASWNNPVNWSGGAVPGNGELAAINASDFSQEAWKESVVYDGSYSAPGLSAFHLTAARNGGTVLFNGPEATFIQNQSNAQLVMDAGTMSASGFNSTSMATAVWNHSAGTTSIGQTLRMSPNPVLGTGAFGQYAVSYSLSGSAALTIGQDLVMGNTNISTGLGQSGASSNTIGRDLHITCTPGASGSAVYSLSGGTLSVANEIRVEGSAARFEQSGGTLITPRLRLQGGTANFPIGSFTVSELAMHSGTLTAGSVHATGGSFARTGRTWVAANLRNSGSLIVDSGGTLTLHGRLHVSDAGTLAIDTASNSKLDLNDNDAVIAPGTPKSTVESYIANARHDGAWDRGGITSTSARTQPQGATTLGVLSGAEYDSVGGTGTFADIAYAPADTLVKYTWYGDTDFNGIVDGDDYARIDSGFNFGLGGWLNGDSDLSGFIDGDDYALIDLAFNVQSGTLRRAVDFISGNDHTLSGLYAPGLLRVREHAERFGASYGQSFLSAVPEPRVLGAFGVLTSVLATSRRRRTVDRNG